MEDHRACREVSPTRLPGRARRCRQFAPRAFRRGADLAEAVGFGEVFDTDYRHGDLWDTDLRDEHRFFLGIYGTQI